MGHRNSFTSSFDAGRYLSFAVIAALVWLGSAYTVSAVAFRKFSVDDANIVLLGYQLEKIAATGTPTTLFLGDSSLGNGIDVRTWSAREGGSATSLALTGVYGYAGTFNLLRRSLAQFRPRNVVIIHTVDLMHRKRIPLGDALTIPPTAQRDLMAKAETFATLLSHYVRTDTMTAVFRGLWLGSSTMRTRYIADDYVRQANIRYGGDEATKAPGILTADSVGLDQAEDLQAIAELCAHANLNCVYAHGPLYERECAAWANYLSAVNERIGAMGLQVVKASPACLKRDELGDAIDHVSPPGRAAVTEAYFALLRPYLK